MAIFMNIVKTAYQGLLKFIKFISVLLSAFLIIIVFLSVISRYFLNLSIPWIEEVSRFIFVWVMFLGAILVNDTFSHMSVDLLLHHVPKRLKLILQMVALVIVIIVLCVMIKGGYIITIGGLNWFSPAVGFPYGVVNSIIPFSCSIMLLQSIAALFRFVADYIGELKKARRTNGI